MQSKLEMAEVRNDLAMAADIKYGSLPEVEATIKAAQRARNPDGLLSEIVSPEEIAKVCTALTSISINVPDNFASQICCQHAMPPRNHMAPTTQ